MDKSATLMPRYKSLRLRIIAMMVLAIIVIEVVILIFATKNRHDQLRGNYFSRTRDAAKFIAADLTKKITQENWNPENLKQYIRYLPLDSQLVIFDLQGQPLGKTGQGISSGVLSAGKAFVREQRTGGQEMGVDARCCSFFPLLDRQQRFHGAMAVVKPDELILQDTVGYVFRILGLVLIICLFTSVVLYWYLQRLIIRPVEYIIEANLEMARDTSTDSIIPEQAIPSHELGAVMRSRNLMISRLRSAQEQIMQQNRELEAWGQNLEEKVSERTEALRATQERMIQTEKLAAIGKLAASVAHEINNPLAILSASAEGLKRELAKMGVDGQRDLEIIKSQVQRCKRIVDSLLRFSRNAPSGPEEIRVGPFLEETAQLIQHRAVKEGKTITLDVQQPESLITAVRLSLQQALVNLLDNALDATESSDGRIILGAAMNGDDVDIWVQDNGAGIPDEIKRRIFEPFFTTKPVDAGTGIGLALTVSFMQSMGGTITCESRPGEGTTFHLRLPRTIEAGGNP